MSTKKRSKKDLRSLFSDTIQKAVGSLELPKPGRKIKKLIDRQSKKLASAYSELLKAEEKKQKKADKLMGKALAEVEKKKKKEKDKKPKGHNGKLVEPITL